MPDCRPATRLMFCPARSPNLCRAFTGLPDFSRRPARRAGCANVTSKARALTHRKANRKYRSIAPSNDRYQQLGCIIEDLVSRRVRGFLATSHEVLDMLLQPGETASVQASLIAAAKEYERKWNALAPSEQRAFLRSALSHIVIDEDKIALVLSTSRLRGALFGAIMSEPTRADPARIRQANGIDEATLWIGPGSSAAVARCA